MKSRTGHTIPSPGLRTPLLDPPVTPAAVKPYADMIRVDLHRGLNNDESRRLQQKIQPAANRLEVDRLWIRPRYKDEMCIRQPSADELLLLDELPLREHLPIAEVEIAYDFIPKPGELELLDDFLLKSLAFPACLDHPYPPYQHFNTTYVAPVRKGEVLPPFNPKYYASKKSKAEPAHGSEVPHLCIRLNRTEAAAIINKPSDLINFDYRAFLLEHMKLVNSDPQALAKRMMGTRRDAADPKKFRRLVATLARATATADGAPSGQEVLKQLEDHPTVQPEVYDLRDYLPRTRKWLIERRDPVPATRKQVQAPPPGRRGREGIAEPELPPKMLDAIVSVLPQLEDSTGRGRPRQSPIEVMKALIHKSLGARAKDLRVKKSTFYLYRDLWMKSCVWQKILGLGLVEQYPVLRGLERELGWF
jgi:hypothetical protein